MSNARPWKRPVPFYCSACKHEWIGMYLPMPLTAATRVMKNATCPSCAAGVDKIRLAPEGVVA